jgi:hypothetical protein
MYNEVTVRFFIDTSKVNVEEMFKVESKPQDGVLVVEVSQGDTLEGGRLALAALKAIAKGDTYESNFNYADEEDVDDDEEFVDAEDYAKMALEHITHSRKLSKSNNAFQPSLL